MITIVEQKKIVLGLRLRNVINVTTVQLLNVVSNIVYNVITFIRGIGPYVRYCWFLLVLRSALE